MGNLLGIVTSVLVALVRARRFGRQHSTAAAATVNRPVMQQSDVGRVASLALWLHLFVGAHSGEVP